MNKVKYGLSNVHYSVITESGGAVDYAVPVAVPGAVELSLDAEGATVKFHADNGVYFSVQNNDGYSGTLEMALLPASFKKDVLGMKEDANGVLFEDRSAQIKPFALLFQFEGDEKATRHVLYRVMASRPKTGSKTTEEEIEVQTDVMDTTAEPASDTGFVKADVPFSSSAYAAFFASVYEYVAPTP